MKEKLNHIKHIETFGINVDDFYSISFSQYEIKLQGKYSHQLVVDLSEFFEFSVSEYGYVISQAVLNGQEISIVLT
jgi:predicted metalloenzyme YecM